MTVAQIIFALGLAAVTLLVAGFALYVVSSTCWAGRWFRAGHRQAGHRRAGHRRAGHRQAGG